MKIQYISDLHLEFQPEIMEQFEISKEADILVFAGDIVTMPKDLELFFAIIRNKNEYIPILYIPGNHEYYGHIISFADTEYEDICDKYGVDYFNNTYDVYKDTLFIGSTLYSDLSGPLDALNVSLGLNDFRIVYKYGRTQITAEDWQQIFNNSVSLIELGLRVANVKKKVVITHFSPSINAAEKFSQRTAISAGFRSDLSYLFHDYEIDCWIYGHTHNPVDLNLNGCQLVSNQLGYPYETDLSLKIKIVEI